MSEKPHPALQRTSPKGEKFVGKCISCGVITDTLNEPCHGPEIAQEDAVIKVMEDDQRER